MALTANPKSKQEAMMNRSAIQARLSDIIEFVLDEKKKQPTVWYPVNLLQNLLSIIEDADDANLLSEIHMIIYHMIEAFDYYHIVFDVVIKCSIDFEIIIALNHALSIVTQLGNSANRSYLPNCKQTRRDKKLMNLYIKFLAIICRIRPEDILKLKQLLSKWLSDFPENADVPRVISEKNSIEFVKLFNKAPSYWDKIFPADIKRILPEVAGSEYQLKIKSQNDLTMLDISFKRSHRSLQ